ncbi:MAG: GNAT family N-acetyltransferase [Planctomycetaceae bacterium]|nr:GNAT family N-acetyltransferase [Planctomycetaceae bacterium]MDC0308324.1 GNAT family N-acetyltransferase [Planctomycetaceae bacterium]MDG2389537.1 GNAT family N-acetyltransferase [Planctomycetaceae bacterium]
MSELQIRTMTREDWPDVAELIHVSTNYWYEANRNMRIFQCRPDQVNLFCRVYENLDPGCCLVVEHPETGRIIGSCFYHPRETHISLGIMNAHPSYFGMGVARNLLEEICQIADERQLPLRLFSSAMNLDSFSLYSRAGFTPYASFQDVLIDVPAEGLAVSVPGVNHVRDATLDDLADIVKLETQLAGIKREKDWRYFLENSEGIWHVSVYETPAEGLSGVIASIADPASRMIGPGVARDEDIAAALLLSELNQHVGETPVWLIPTECQSLAQTLYSWGARNCELHFGQVRGGQAEFQGVLFPTFMPETA